MSTTISDDKRRPGVRGHCDDCDRDVERPLPLSIIGNASGKYVACRECGSPIWCRKAELSPDGRGGEKVTDGGAIVPDREVHHRSREARKQIRELAEQLSHVEFSDEASEYVERLREAKRVVEDVEADLTGSVDDLPPREVPQP